MLTVDLTHHTTNRTVLQFVAADYAAAGHVMLYVSDSGAGCLLVYNGRYKTVHRLSFPVLAKGSGGRDDNDDDILYMEYVKLGPLEPDRRALILTYFAGRQVYTLDVSSVREPDSGDTSVQASPVAKYVGEKPIKMVVIGSDAAGHLYFRDVERANAVYSWHVDEPLVEQSFKLRRRTPDCRKPTHAAPGGVGHVVWLLETDVKDFVARRVGCMGSSSRLQAIVIT